MNRFNVLLIILALLVGLNVFGQMSNIAGPAPYAEMPDNYSKEPPLTQADIDAFVKHYDLLKYAQNPDIMTQRVPAETGLTVDRYKFVMVKTSVIARILLDSGVDNQSKNEMLKFVPESMQINGAEKALFYQNEKGILNAMQALEANIEAAP